MRLEMTVLRWFRPGARGGTPSEPWICFPSVVVEVTDENRRSEGLRPSGVRGWTPAEHWICWPSVVVAVTGRRTGGGRCYTAEQGGEKLTVATTPVGIAFVVQVVARNRFRVFIWLNWLGTQARRNDVVLVELAWDASDGPGREALI
ncbi:hypothetical protein Acr_13g0014890 [Actinidia rufa]|uniref:Uncharacterized protein n=1 Tax=Actinidia rufa TaxID=165716 RepID=A0A7J0FPJ3_9ERIC|nr:hypothetical protein Acr_13g0014890 [Actinidia rufa]